MPVPALPGGKEWQAPPVLSKLKNCRSRVTEDQRFPRTQCCRNQRIAGPALPEGAKNGGHAQAVETKELPVPALPGGKEWQAPPVLS